MSSTDSERCGTGWEWKWCLRVLYFCLYSDLRQALQGGTMEKELLACCRLSGNGDRDLLTRESYLLC